MAVSIQGETITFEKVFPRKEFTQVYPVPPSQSPDIQIDQLKNEIESEIVELGTIRLESGDSLNLNVNSIRHFRAEDAPPHQVENDAQNRYWSSDNLGDKWKFAYFSFDIAYDNFEKIQNIKIRHNGKKKWEEEVNNEYITANDNMWPIDGPATIKVSVRPYHSHLMFDRRRDGDIRNRQDYKINTRPDQFIRISLEKEITSTNNNLKRQQVLVLPKGSGVNELVLESSEDLVNWEKDSLGDKNTDAGNRFYRLRAVKK
jgi:hypothetical protein